MLFSKGACMFMHLSRSFMFYDSGLSKKCTVISNDNFNSSCLPTKWLCHDISWCTVHRVWPNLWFDDWIISNLVGGWPTPLKNISHFGWLFAIYGKHPLKSILNHYHPYSSHMESHNPYGKILPAMFQSPQGGAPPVISWFINPINYRYIYHKP